MQKLSMKNKKGQLINLVSASIFAFFALILGAFAVLYAISILNPGSFFTASSANQNATNDLTGNLTSGISQFGSRIPTVMVILGAVIALGAIAFLVVFVRQRFVGSESNGAGL